MPMKNRTCWSTSGWLTFHNRTLWGCSVLFVNWRIRSNQQLSFHCDYLDAFINTNYLSQWILHWKDRSGELISCQGLHSSRSNLLEPAHQKEEDSEMPTYMRWVAKSINGEQRPNGVLFFYDLFWHPIPFLPAISFPLSCYFSICFRL